MEYETKKRKQLIQKIIVIFIILMIFELILLAVPGNLDAIRTLWKTP